MIRLVSRARCHRRLHVPPRVPCRSCRALRVGVCLMRSTQPTCTPRQLARRRGHFFLVFDSLLFFHVLNLSSKTLLNESSERAHQLVALGLLARIFYASEPLGEALVFGKSLAVCARLVRLPLIQPLMTEFCPPLFVGKSPLRGIHLF